MIELSPVTVTLENQQQHGETVFPYALCCQKSDASLADAISWMNRQKTDLLDLATQHGAVLLRDFPVSNAIDFDAMVCALELNNFPYRKSLSNAVRINRTDRVFSANEAPSEVRIFFHHEMAQTPLYPRWIFFNCEVAAPQGGATPLCRSDVLYERIRNTYPQFADMCEEKGFVTRMSCQMMMTPILAWEEAGEVPSASTAEMQQNFDLPILDTPGSGCLMAA